MEMKYRRVVINSTLKNLSQASIIITSRLNIFNKIEKTFNRFSYSRKMIASHGTSARDQTSTRKRLNEPTFGEKIELTHQG